MSDRRTIGTKKLPFRRHFISLELKIKILDCLKTGEKVSLVAKTLNLNEATIRTIQKNEQKIRASVAASCSISAKITARPRAPIIEKMEKALILWIDDCSKKEIPVGINVIQHKALEIYNQLKENGESPTHSGFVASKGWFHRFKRHISLQKIRIQGKNASADNEAAKMYPEELRSIVEQGGYTAHQVFNADEIGLWWKKMPNITFISKNKKLAPDFKVSRDRVTLLMCSNAAGDHMVKPMLVNKSLNPYAMKYLNKFDLPVYWTADKKALATTDLFKEWFSNCFVPSVENYLKQKNLNFKALLILNNAPSHPKDLNHPNIEITFLPPNTTSLIQPLDQGIIATFKAHYIKQSLQWVLKKMENKSIEVMKAWNQFNILDCINLISAAIKEIKPCTLNASWKNIWPESVQSGNLIEPVENIIDAIVEIANSLGGVGFNDMKPEDIEELLIKEELNKAEVSEVTSEMDIVKEDLNDTSDTSTDVKSEVQNFNLQSIQEGMRLAEQLEFYFAGKPVVVSAHFLQSMATQPTPLNTEIVDVANTITDGTDCLKISEEVVKGNYTMKYISLMKSICREAEASINYSSIQRTLQQQLTPPIKGSYSIAMSAVETAVKCKAACIIVITKTGRSAKLIAMQKPYCPVIAVTRIGHIARKIRLWRAVMSLHYLGLPHDNWMKDIQNRFDYGIRYGKCVNIIRAGDTVVLVNGSRNCNGFANTLKVVHASGNNCRPVKL